MVDGELAPVMNIGDGVVDDVLQTTVTSNPWSATSISSSNGDEVRLETTTASGGINGEVLRRKFVRPSVRKSARGREGVRDKRGSAVSFTAWVPTKIGGVSARSPARNFTSLAAPNREGKGGRRERGCWAL
jgi:hypothetical protein